jgi:exopolyphosphatase/guanosine-5'-triphosphate,3'-diphosphate pyrophosphatase
MRIAAIDLGTNSIHMVIARAAGTSGLEVVDREREVVQIGRGSFATGRLRLSAARRTLEALDRFVRLAKSHQADRILCTATAAVREASNGGVFLRQAQRLTGVMPRVIPGAEEGRLNYLAIASALPLGEKTSLVIDIGGGSVQLVAGDAQGPQQAMSVPLGALRLTELWLSEDPPGERELERLRKHIKVTAAPALRKLRALKPKRVFGSSGAIHALAQAVHHKYSGRVISQLNGHFLPLALLRRLLREIESAPLDERERLQGLDARRAEIIVPGAMVLVHVLEALGADGITLSDFSLREGLVIDYARRHAQEISALESIADLKLRSVLRLLAKFQADGPHPQHVMRLSLALFDGLADRHGLGELEREWLRHAALLHDIGSAIGHDNHTEHSWYIVRNGNLRGFAPEEIDVVANVARYHGKRRPRKRDRAFGDLSKSHRWAVRWLAAILRIAEALDRSQYQLVRELRVARRGRAVAILLTASGDVQLELWAARQRTQLLADLLKNPLVVGLERGVRSGPRSRRGSAKKPRRAAVRSQPPRAAPPRSTPPTAAPSRRAPRGLPAPPPGRAGQRGRGRRPKTPEEPRET